MMTNTASRSRLLSPYPGGKALSRYPVHDGGRYDAWICPFAGSGEQESWVAQTYPDLPIVAADADFLVKVVWECWAKPRLRKAVASLIEAWQLKIAVNPQAAFNELAAIATWYYCPDHQSSYNPVLVATASILLRRLTFGGVMRLNSRGVFNVGLSQDKLKSFLAGWRFEWPQPPKSLAVFSDWSEAVDFVTGHDRRCPETNYRNAIAIVDPPYCSGTTAAYAHADGALSMALDCVELLLASGHASRIVAFNYWGEWVEGCDCPAEYPIVEAMQQLGAKHGREVWFSRLGTLATMNKGPGQATVHRYEGVWEIGGKRLYGDRMPVKHSPKHSQLTLL